jgi:cytochrome c oxidase subunit 2
MFSPVSPQATAITTLTVILFGISTAIFLLVLGLVAYACIRFRDVHGRGEPPQGFGSVRLEVLWTAAPIVLLVVVFGLTVRAVRASDPATPDGREPDISLVGHQWWWEVRYPRANVVTANEIHMPIGTRVLLELSSADVIHDFWVPQLGRKMDMTPGHPTRLWIEADAAATYTGACAEYCGAEHAWMRMRVVAEPAAQYATWLADERRPAAQPASGSAADGVRLFRELTCGNCHAIGGTELTSRIGPDLTHLASRQMLAGELLQNSPANLARWLAAPDALKPASHMPNAHLSSQQVQALVAYLETLR